MNQLQTRYKRNLKSNYMIINFSAELEKKMDFNSYEYKMLENNYISGLMRLKLKEEEGIHKLYYDITSKQSLARILEYRQVGLEDIKNIVFNLIRSISNMERFLLIPPCLYLDIEHIYADPESLELKLCYVPGIDRVKELSLSELFSQILACIDQKDSKGVVLAYSLYQESLKEDCVLDDLLNIMNEHNEQSKKELQYQSEAVKKSDLEYNRYEDEYEAEKLEKPEGFSIRALFGAKRDKKAASEKAENSDKLYNKAHKQRDDEIDNVYIVEREDKKYKKEAKDNGKAQKAIAEIDEETSEWLQYFSAKDDAVRDDCYIDKPYMQTMLLSEKDDGKDIYILKAMDKNIDDIELKYFPFIIGKQERICDYVMKSDMVSRLHLRINMDAEGGFTLRDLNSLNGTKLASRLLDNEEVAALYVGDEIEIANLRYVFKKLET